MDNDLKVKLGAILAEVDANSVDAPQMILTCRRILDTWMDAGGSSTDDDIIGFFAIEAQTSHVLGGPGVHSGRDGDHMRFEPGSAEEAAEIEDCGRVFLPGFGMAMDDLKSRLNASQQPMSSSR
jgi:hypothetical protein